MATGRTVAARVATLSIWTTSSASGCNEIRGEGHRGHLRGIGGSARCSALSDTYFFFLFMLLLRSLPRLGAPILLAAFDFSNAQLGKCVILFTFDSLNVSSTT